MCSVYILLVTVGDLVRKGTMLANKNSYDHIHRVIFLFLPDKSLKAAYYGNGRGRVFRPATGF